MNEAAGNLQEIDGRVKDTHADKAHTERVILPDAETFRKALEKIVLPSVVCNRPYECYIKVFHSNNKFEGRYDLIDIQIEDGAGLKVSVEGDKKMFHISGMIESTEYARREIPLQVKYRALDKGKVLDAEMKLSIVQSPEDTKKQEAFEQSCRMIEGWRAKIITAYVMSGGSVNLRLSAAELEKLVPNFRFELCGQSNARSGLSVKYIEDSKEICVSGTATEPGEVELKITFAMEGASSNAPKESFNVKLLQITPDPKTLWKDSPTDSKAPYPSKNEEHVCISAGDKTIVAASKRGRSHAHDGKFRDDNFKVEYIEETGWFIVAISDGAGSARYSREGSRIACETFCTTMKTKLSLSETNEKIKGMSVDVRESILKKTVLKATYECLTKIDAEAKSAKEREGNIVRKDYSATFLGYIMKRFEGEWLVVSIGIGDGIIGLMDLESHVTLLSEPDGGEFVGQTRFITMNDVWQENPINRVRVKRVKEFSMILSMTDGVSDPKFETDNNLKNEDLWRKLKNDLDASVPLDKRSDVTASKLSDWLDFWSKGNHDDRTIVLVY